MTLATWDLVDVPADAPQSTIDRDREPHVMHIVDPRTCRGRDVVWFPDDASTVELAEKEFAVHMATGFLACAVVAPGQLETMHRFDKTVRKIILTSPLQGG